MELWSCGVVYVHSNIVVYSYRCIVLELWMCGCVY